MAKKEIIRILNDFIAETKAGEKTADLSRMASLDLPVETSDHSLYWVGLDQVVIFDGIESIVSQLIERTMEACFLGQTDISVQVNVERQGCRQLYDYGVHKIFLYSAIENMEELPVLQSDIINHLRYIFNALQSFGISNGFFEKKMEQKASNALLFPFDREVKNDQTRLHYLVERVEGSHFLRITIEDLEHSRLNFRKIDHRIISNIGLIQDHFNLRSEALALYGSVVNRCRDGWLNFRDSGLQFHHLIHFLIKVGYDQLHEISISWTRDNSADLLMNPERPWFGHLSRLLLILPDSTTKNLLSEGKSICTRFSGTTVYVTLSQRSRNLQINFHEQMAILPLSNYLTKMERVKLVCQPGSHLLENVHLIFIHHFTAETLAVLGAFDQLNIRQIDTLWVKYSGNIPSSFLETILSLPASVYRFYGLQQMVGPNNQLFYRLSQHYSSLKMLHGLQNMLVQQNHEFLDAMQFVAMHLFFNAISGVEEGVRVAIAEDGGYLAPLINRMALEGLKLKEVFEKFNYDHPLISKEEREQLFYEWIKPRYCGSIEHTRNGYDSLATVEKEFSTVAFPACTLAISNYKVNDESVEVAYSCLNAIENILNAQGYVLNRRRCLVLGSLGAIGRQTMKILTYRLGAGNISGIDVKTDADQDYPWEQWSAPSRLPAEIRYSTDLIFGVVGRSVLDDGFFEDVLINTSCSTLFLASGSTKRFEFSGFIEWTELLIKQSSPKIKGLPVTIVVKPIEDPQTSSLQGTAFVFEIKKSVGIKKVEVCLLSYGMPINFHYYGVPRETMDQVMAEFVSLVKVVANSERLPKRLLALDHEIDVQGNLIG